MCKDCEERVASLEKRLEACDDLLQTEMEYRRGVEQKLEVLLALAAKVCENPTTTGIAQLQHFLNTIKYADNLHLAELYADAERYRKLRQLEDWDGIVRLGYDDYDFLLGTALDDKLDSIINGDSMSQPIVNLRGRERVRPLAKINT